MEILAEEDISIHDAKKLMGGRKKERDLVYTQKICFDYLEKVAGLTEKQFENITEELSKIAILKPRYIALILNMMPTTEEEVESLFSKERTNLKKDEIAQIVSIVKKYKK